MWGIVGIAWLISYVNMILKERTFINNLKRKMFKKKDEPEIVNP